MPIETLNSLIRDSDERTWQTHEQEKFQARISTATRIITNHDFARKVIDYIRPARQKLWKDTKANPRDRKVIDEGYNLVLGNLEDQKDLVSYLKNTAPHNWSPEINTFLDGVASVPDFTEEFND